MVCTVYTTSPFSSASAHLTPSKGTYSLQISHIRRIRRTSQLIRHQPLHEKRHAKDIHPCTMQRLDGRRIRPDVIRAQSAGDIPGAEFSARLVATEPCFLSIHVFRKRSRGRRGTLKARRPLRPRTATRSPGLNEQDSYKGESLHLALSHRFRFSSLAVLHTILSRQMKSVIYIHLTINHHAFCQNTIHLPGSRTDNP